MLYAHYDRDLKIGQPLIEHIENVGLQMKADTVALNFSNITKKEIDDMLYLVGIYHDIGKSMDIFQDYLKTGKGGSDKNHSLISAAIFSTMFNKNDVFAYLSFLAIAKHHGNIDSTINEEGQDFYRLSKQYIECFDSLERNRLYIKNIKKTNLENLKNFMKTKLYITNKRIRSDEYFFQLQYIFSKLIWADKIDSASLSNSTVDNCKGLSTVEQYINKKNDGKIIDLNDKRNKIKNTVLKKINSLSNDEIKENRIFTLTAPTGTGKTLTSISASISIGERIKKLYGYNPRIITALPFINILEQTKEDYEGIFNNILVHHSASDYYEKQNEGIILKDRLLLTSAWENDVIITTFVQFFESILCDKNSKILKVNKLSGSVVILDEIQSLPSKYYPLIGAVIKRLSDFYGTRFILMTATQPEIVSYANNILTDNKMSAIELLENNYEYYRDLKRTKIVPVMDEVKDNNTLVDFIYKTRGDGQSALVVVNTISQSIEIYNLLYGKYQSKCQVLYLSTNLISIDRKKVINKAKDFLEHRIPFIMVSTQTIEAGVDLDFDIGFRDMSPLESIIQVAGRINRSGQKKDFSPLYVFDTGSEKSIYKMYNIHKTKEILTDEILESEYRQIIKEYYETLLLEDKSYDTEIYEAIKMLDYSKITSFT